MPGATRRHRFGGLQHEVSVFGDRLEHGRGRVQDLHIEPAHLAPGERVGRGRVAFLSERPEQFGLGRVTERFQQRNRILDPIL
jgi:hypothetical protein